MSPRPTIDDSQELDRYVVALEEAYRQQASVELTQLVPATQHPLFDDIVRELVRVDIELRAERGTRVDLDFYHARFPSLFTRRDDLEAVAYEDYRQRQLAGEHPQPEEYSRRWNIDVSGWPTSERESHGSTPLEVAVRPGQSLVDSLSDRRDTHGSRRDPTLGPEPPSTETLPKIGDEFLGFELLALLGRGAFAKVYLARQGELADRPVALKIARRVGGEPQTLARLQHTNIVPIYSVHRSGTFQAVCMPYLGGVTLADVVRELRERRRQPESGRMVVDTVLAHQLNSPWPDTEVALSGESLGQPTADQPAANQRAARTATPLQTLAGLSYVEAVLWIGSRLADGLAHAHERGILHRDLKPANVLLASDGQPLLLDFNLSQDRHTAQLGRSAHIGGTLPYMAPEMLRAFQLSMSGGDERSDIYSLGLVLYELLTGEYPFPLRHGEVDQLLVDSLADRRGTVVSPRQLNSAVSPAAAAIVMRCLQYDPTRRYASARQLQEDLQCQLEQRPLQHTREPSLVERGRKWIRRHPRLASTTGVAALATTLLLALGGLLVVRNGQVARFEAQQQLERIEQNVRSARVTFLDVVHDQPRAQPQLDQLLADVLSRANIAAEMRLDAAVTQRWSTARAEAYFLQAASLLRRAEQASSAETSQQQLAAARDLAQSALATFKHPQEAPRVFQWLTDKLSNAPSAAVAAFSAQGTSARDLGYQATLLSSERRFREARSCWEQLTQIDPQNVWAWYGLGHCLERLGDFAVAAECYSACIALAPQQSQWHFRRGLCHLQRHQDAQARQDFSAVLQLEPAHHEALINRALAALALDDTSSALDDLSRALKHGGDAARLLLLRAQVRERTGDNSGAAQDRATGLAQAPHDEQGWTARGVLRVSTDPQRALADFDQALKLNPSYLPALESKAHVLSERLDDLDGALKVLDEALRWHPHHSPTLAASGVLLARKGDTGLAKSRAEQALANDLSPSILYQVAGIFALLSIADDDHRERAFSLLTSALRAGFGVDLVEHDHDLAPLRLDPRFQQLLAAVDALRAPVVKSPSP